MSLILPQFSLVHPGSTFSRHIQNAGLSSSLVLCLDAGDEKSYPGSGQSFLDTSGNGSDFFLGADGSATATDPTFNGLRGRRSSAEYFSFDGGDYFTYDAANTAFMNSIHKNNATFTFLTWVYFGGFGTLQAICGTSAQATAIGASLYVSTTPNLNFVVSSGDGTFELNQSGLTPTSGAWQMVGVSVNEATGAGGGLFFRNGTTASFTSTYTSPSASDAPSTFQIGAVQNGIVPLVSGSRMACFAAFDTALNEAQMDAIYDASRGRFGL